MRFEISGGCSVFAVGDVYVSCCIKKDVVIPKHMQCKIASSFALAS